MMHKVIKILFSICLFFSSGIIYAQSQKLRTLPREYLLVEINRSFFIPGEELRVAIKAEVGENSFLISRVAYLELVDPKNSSVIKQKVSLNEGYADATLYLPSYLKSGNYTLLVYTQWMKNFGYESLIQRKISLINPFIELPKNLIQNPHSTDSLHILLYPEGGHFIYGANQRIGYRIENCNAEITPASIQIKDGASATVLDIKSTPGYGYFDLKLQPDTVYGITLVDNLEKIHFSRLKTYGALKKVAVIIENDTNFEISALDPDKNIFIEFWKNSNLILSKNVDSTKYRFNCSQFPKGLLTCRIVDENGSVKFSKLLFNEPDKVKLKVELGKKTYHPRENISLSLSSEIPIDATLVIKKKQPLDDQGNMVSNHFLGSQERKIPLDWPLKEMDTNLLLMLDASINTIKHNEQVTYLPDFRGELITGLLHDTNNIPVSNYNFFITIASDYYNLYTATTNGKGIFKLSIPPGHSGDQLIFSDIKNYQVEMKQPFLKTYNFIHQDKLVIHNPNIEEWLIPKSQEVQIKNIYTKLDKKAIETKGMFYNKSRIVYKLDDYTRFPTLADHIIEYIPEITIRKTNGERKFSIRNVNNRSEEYNQVLCVLNGIVCSAEEVLSYDPLKIKQIEIYQSQFQLGDKLFTGTINFLTYPDESIINGLFNNSLLKSYQPVHESKTTESTKIDESPRTPDMRIQLAWKPHISINQNISQFTFRISDIPGTYEVIISGVNSDNYVYERLEFEVVDK